MHCPALPAHGPPAQFWVLPKDRAGLSLPRLHDLGAGGSGVSLSPSFSPPRGSFRTAVLNPRSTVTHAVLMQDTLLWAHPNYEETLSPKCRHQNKKFCAGCQSKSRFANTHRDTAGGSSNTAGTLVSVRLPQVPTAYLLGQPIGFLFYRGGN